MKLEQLAKLKGQHSDLIVVQEQLSQRGHLADLGRQRPDLVIRNVQVLQVGQIADHGWQAHQIIVVQRQVLQVVPLPELRAEVLDVAVDLHLDPRGQHLNLGVVRVVVVFRVVRVVVVVVVVVIVRVVLLTVDHDVLTEGAVRRGAREAALRVHDAHVHGGRLHQMVSIRRVRVGTGEELVEAVGAGAVHDVRVVPVIVRCAVQAVVAAAVVVVTAVVAVVQHVLVTVVVAARVRVRVQVVAVMRARAVAIQTEQDRVAVADRVVAAAAVLEKVVFTIHLIRVKTLVDETILMLMVGRGVCWVVRVLACEENSFASI
jgi:hypothetical protein